MASVTQEKIVALLKKDSEMTQGKVAQKLGVTVGQVPMLLFSKAQVEAGVYTKAPATQASVKKLRNEGNRWELIAARTNLSVAQVKQHAEAAGVLNSYTGRGRNFNGSNKKSAPAAGRKTGGRQTAKPAAGRKTGGRQTAGAGRSTRRNPS